MGLFWYTAERIPKGTANTSMMTSDRRASLMVGHSRASNMAATGCLLWYDVPKSPCRHDVSQFQYCTSNGSFSPISSRI